MLRREPWAGVGHRTFAQSHLRIIRDPTLTKPLHRLGPIALSHGRTFAPRKSDRTLWRLCVSRSHLRTHRTLALSHFRTTQPTHSSRARGTSYRSHPSHLRTFALPKLSNPYMRAGPGGHSGQSHPSHLRTFALPKLPTRTCELSPGYFLSIASLTSRFV